MCRKLSRNTAWHTKESIHEASVTDKTRRLSLNILSTYYIRAVNDDMSLSGLAVCYYAYAGKKPAKINAHIFTIGW